MEKVALDLVTIVINTAEKDVLEDRCLKALSKLSSIPVNADFILSTNIGQIISSIQSNPRRKQVIRDGASRVLTCWRCQLYHRSPSNLHPQSPNVANQNTPKPTPNPNLKPSPNPKPKPFQHQNNSLNTQKKKQLLTTKPPQKPTVKKSSNKLKPPPEKQVVKADVDSIRNNIRLQIFEGLNLALKESQIHGNVDPIGVAMSIESTLYENWGIFSENSNKYRSLLYNLKDARNPDFRRKILTGELKTERIAKLKAEDMASNQKRNQIENIRDIALKKCIVGRNEF